jgi:Mg2+/Co2+ transporter CorB
MNILQVLEIIWPVILALLAFVIWLVRLEGKVKQSENLIAAHREEYRSMVATAHTEIKTLTAKHESLDSKVVEQLAQVRESLARIEGFLGVKHKEN